MKLSPRDCRSILRGIRDVINEPAAEPEHKVEMIRAVFAGMDKVGVNLDD